MDESPHRSILNREQARATVEDKLANQLTLLRDIANYGSNLVVRCFHTSQKQLPEIIVCGVLLKQVVAMVDATEVLLSAGGGVAAHLTVRTAFEASLCVDWILQRESERRAKLYYVHNIRAERAWTRAAIDGTPEKESVRKIMAQIDHNLPENWPNIGASAGERLIEIDQLLNLKEFSSINQEFDSWREKSKRNFDPDWYKLDKISTIREMAKVLNRLPEYEFHYKLSSKVTHSVSYKHHVRFISGNMIFVPLRNLDDATSLFNLICTIAFGTFRKVLEKYRPDEIMAFNKKYLDDWRVPFLGAPKITIDFAGSIAQGKLLPGTKRRSATPTASARSAP